jgi:hypothetical protein
MTMRIDESDTRARSTPESLDIRRRSFCLLTATEDRLSDPDVPLSDLISAET